MLRAKCPVCGKTTKGGDDWAGRKANCPSCNAPIVFPVAEAAAETFLEPMPVVAPAVATSGPPSVPVDQTGGVRPLSFGILPKQRFRALEVMATLYQILAAFIAVFAVLAFFAQLLLILSNRVNGVQAAVGAVSALVTGAMAVLTVLAISQFIRLMIQLERNTRETNETLIDLVVAMQADK